MTLLAVQAHPTMSHLRDILVTTIYEGPNVVLRQYVIATQAFRD